jgi:hypothetical protein
MSAAPVAAMQSLPDVVVDGSYWPFDFGWNG